MRLAALTSPGLASMYDDYTVQASEYGGGFTWTHRLSTPPVYRACIGSAVSNTTAASSAEVLMRESRDERLRAGYFNVLVVAQASNTCCGVAACYGRNVLTALNSYIERKSAEGGALVVVTVDGGDIDGCHTTLADELLRVDVHFLREVDPARVANARLVHPPLRDTLNEPLQ